MRSTDLADEVEAAINRCRSRILGVGKDQYEEEPDTQKFETMPFDQLIDWALEELDDVINYAVMLGIQVRRVRDVLKGQSVMPGGPGDGARWVVTAPTMESE
jgi:hypothetical protein